MVMLTIVFLSYFLYNRKLCILTRWENKDEDITKGHDIWESEEDYF